MSPVKVSVITGYYNRRDVLERTLDSLLSQTFDDYEVILFDDASTDGTALELERLADKYQDPRFRYVVHETNQGFVQGMINAIASARGEYIAVHGSGDVAAPNRLERQAAVLDSDPDVGAVGSWLTNVNDSTGHRFHARPNADVVTLSMLMTTNVFSHGEVMMRRSVYDEVGGYRREFTFAQDIDLWLRIRQNYRLATVPEFLYERHVLSDGVTYNPRKSPEQARFSILARRLLEMGPLETAKTLELVRLQGPGAVIQKDDPVFQERSVGRAIEMARLGATSDAILSAKENISSPLKRDALIAVFTVHGSRFAGAPLRGALRARRGVKKLWASTRSRI